MFDMAPSIEILDFESQENLAHRGIGNLYTLRMDIGGWIKQCRARAGLTQTELGERLAVTKGNVSAWETNKHEPSYGQMIQIAKLAQHTVPLPGVASPIWPFQNVSPEQYDQLTEREQGQIEERVLTLLENHNVKSSSGSAAA